MQEHKKFSKTVPRNKNEKRKKKTKNNKCNTAHQKKNIKQDN